VRGFTNDGFVWHSAVAATPLRVMDASSGEVVSHYEGGDPTRGSDAHVACIYKNEIVLADSRGKSRLLKLKHTDH